MLTRKVTHRNKLTLQFEVLPNVFVDIYSAELPDAPHAEQLYELLEHLDKAGREWEIRSRLIHALLETGKSERQIMELLKDKPVSISELINKSK